MVSFVLNVVEEIDVFLLMMLWMLYFVIGDIFVVGVVLLCGFVLMECVGCVKEVIMWCWIDDLMKE